MDENLIGTNLKILRIKKGLTQKELGHLIGVTFVTISRYETGVQFPTHKRLKKIISVFDCTMSDVLS